MTASVVTLLRGCFHLGLLWFVCRITQKLFKKIKKLFTCLRDSYVRVCSIWCRCNVGGLLSTERLVVVSFHCASTGGTWNRIVTACHTYQSVLWNHRKLNEDADSLEEHTWPATTTALRHSGASKRTQWRNSDTPVLMMMPAWIDYCRFRSSNNNKKEFKHKLPDVEDI